MKRLPARCVATLLLAAAFPLTASAATAAAAVVDEHSSSARPFRIVLALYRGCEAACEGFKAYWAQHKVPVQIETLDAATDTSRLPDFVKKVKASRPDLLVTWGTTVSLAMLGRAGAADPARHITDIPAVFMIASTPVGSGLVPSLQSSRRNVTGTLYLVSPDTQLNAASLYLQYKRVGYILNPAENNSAVTLEELRAEARSDGFELIARTLPLDAAGKPDKAALPRLVDELAEAKADLLYMAPDTFLLMNRDAITARALERKLPVLASAEAAVLESQALMGVVNRYYTVGQLTAYKADQILRHKIAPQDIPITAPPGFSYIVNMRTARELGRYPPMRVLRLAEVVR